MMEYQKITKVSKNSQKNNSEIVTNENDKEIPNDSRGTYNTNSQIKI